MTCVGKSVGWCASQPGGQAGAAQSISNPHCCSRLPKRPSWQCIVLMFPGQPTPSGNVPVATGVGHSAIAELPFACIARAKTIHSFGGRAVAGW